MTDSAPFETLAINGKKYTIGTGLFIDNKFVNASTSEKTKVYNPATGEHLATIQKGNEADVDIAVKVARRTFESGWADSDPAWRGSLLNKLADIMEKNFDEILAIEMADAGKTYKGAAAADLPESIATLRYYGSWADKVFGRTSPTVPGTFAYTVREPVGVCGQVIPWNFPLMMFVWKIAPALATGNTVVMKAAELTPLSALKMCEYIREAGFPAGAFNLVCGSGRVVGNALASHMDVDKIAFTGSTATGRTIMKNAAMSNLKKVTLELGGKGPNIVFPDADIEKAVDWSVYGIDFNAGQVCHSGTRLYVHEDIYDEFLAAFTKKMVSLKVGDNFDKTIDQGPVIDKKQFEKIMGMIESGKKEGAHLQAGGHAVQRSNTAGSEGGYFIEPTVFTNVTPEMEIVREEIFGPVIVIAKFKTEEEVLKLANDTAYGLSSGLHTKDYQRAVRVARKLRAGTAWVNMYNVVHPSMPFGGYKQSGLGRELGSEALDNYTQVKTVMLNMDLPAPNGPGPAPPSVY